MGVIVDVSTNAGRDDFLRDYVVFRDDVFAKKLKTFYIPDYIPLDAAIEWHLSGKQTYGVYQLCDGLVKWVCYDIDDHDGQQLAKIDLDCVREQLTKNGVSHYVERSGSRNSYHVWVFLEPAVPVETAYNWSRWQLIDRGVPVSTCEVFPKQQTGSVEFGNLVKMPFAINRATLRRSRFTDGDEFELCTVDITGHTIKPLPDRRHKRRGGDARKTSDYRGVRPCIAALVGQAVPLEHYSGHRLRIAVATEYLNRTNHTDADIAKLFAVQKDYSYDISYKQVKSLSGYKPAKCDTIREHAKALDHTLFDIDECCNKCIMR